MLLRNVHIKRKATVLIQAGIAVSALAFCPGNSVHAQPSLLDSSKTKTATYLQDQKNLTLVKNKVSIKGTFISESQYNSYNWDGQFNPKAYSRFYFIPQIQIGKIPLTGRFNLSSESTPLQYSRYNNFSLRFDSRQFQALMQKEIETKLRQETQNQANPLFARATDSFNKYQKLSQQLADPQYLKKIERYSMLLRDTIKMDCFSKMQNRFQILDSKLMLESHQKKLEDAKRLEKWKTEYDSLKTKQPEIPLNTDSLNRATTAKLSPFYKLASMVRDFQIGTCYPLISPFTMQGIALNGGYSQLQAGRIITAFGYGSTIKPQFNLYSLTPSWKSDDRLLVTSLGYASKKGSQVIVHYLEAKDYSKKPTLTWEPLAVSNRVLSIEGKTMVKALTLEGEIARSSTVPVKYPDGNPISNLISGSDNKNQAARFTSTLNLQKLKTELSAKMRWIGSDFRSKGTPYLRHDVASMNAGIKKYFLKNALFLQAEGGKELTNVSESEAVKGGWTTWTFQGGLSLPSYPVIVAGYIPTQQYYDYIESDSNIRSVMDMKFIQMSHVLNICKMPVTLLAMYSDSRASTTNYSFLNRYFTFDVSAPLSSRYLLHSTFMQAVTTQLLQAVTYQYASLDITKTTDKTIGLGLQYRKSELSEISSIYALCSLLAFGKVTSFVKLEMLNVRRFPGSPFYDGGINNKIEAGASLRLTYSL